MISMNNYGQLIFGFSKLVMYVGVILFSTL